MIFTIGYDKFGKQHGGVAQLVAVMDQHHITLLVDVRSKPRSKYRAFNRPVLEWALKERYRWEGDRLGGLEGVRSPSYSEGLAWLAKQGQKENVLVMCMETDPDKCHRKKWIAADLKRNFGIDAAHL